MNNGRGFWWCGSGGNASGGGGDVDEVLALCRASSCSGYELWRDSGCRGAVMRDWCCGGIVVIL